MAINVIRGVTEIDKHVYFITIFGSITLTVSLIFLLSKISLAVIDFATIMIVSTRAVLIFAIFSMIGNGVTAFEQVDLKQLADGINFVAFPAMLLFAINWKVEIFLTVPTFLISIYYCLQLAYAQEDGNLACFINADELAPTQFSRRGIELICYFFAVHDSRKTQLVHFIARERARNQQ